jgi:hypothetical protein
VTGGLRPVILAWMLVAALTGLPYLRAGVDPPPGRAFVGFFFFVDDSYHYLSYVQQAAEGAFLFRNKLLLEDHPPSLVNLEWWLVGRLSAALGGHPLIAYRLLGLLAAFFLLSATDRWLRRCGLPDSHRLPALLLVALGGGFGGLLFLAGRPAFRCLDFATGLFPSLELLSNPHFVVGTALLLWTLWTFLNARTRADYLVGTLLGSVLGLVRPYDLILVVAIHGLSVLVVEPPAAWARRLIPLAGLAPVALYNYWVFYVNRSFAFFTTGPYPFPPRVDFVWAFGPAAALAATAAWARPAAPETRAARVHLLAWIAMGVLVIAIHAVTFSLQFLVGFALPFFAFAAIGLSRFRPAVTLAATVALSTTMLVALRVVLTPHPRWQVPTERLGAAFALRAGCKPDEVVFAPQDIGLYAIGLTACKAYVSHPIMPGFADRVAEARTFYEASDAAARAALLDREHVTHLVLPGDPGPRPTAWLGEETPFLREAVVGRAPSLVSLYSRAIPSPSARQ